MVRPTACFHTDLATWLYRLEENLEPTRPRQLSAPYSPLVAINSMNQEDRLCQIDANTHKVHGGPLLSVDWSMTLPVWHVDAVQVREGSIPLLLAGERHGPAGPCLFQTSVCSAISSASSTSIPRYLPYFQASYAREEAEQVEGTGEPLKGY
jgi:hypothetical protein